ncbi:group 1 glycosyl transferase [Natrialba hulunbeirensis JCM 10989]|uniref:Group 1 glycosyl transferase n=1 Tax=Natrialba hulunbeirensis JCM 10989 TaxID=1227493 RepID=L9ZQ63_9EURY|nr:glycosyltransferase [Natrialba hulunbeirensis]ELY87298.1 group 1 glycosyl transferase [Natrialba hulunbeirensis JCM 10989]
MSLRTQDGDVDADANGNQTEIPAGAGSPADGDRCPTGDANHAHSVAESQRVLVITGLAHKNERHYGPLADVAGETTLVSLAPVEGVDTARNVTVPQVGPRLLRVVLLFVVALLEARQNEYDAVASISLFPYGCYALGLKAMFGLPAHLGIIGIDLDHHATQRYGPVVRWLFRRFDIVSVPGTDHAARLERCGVPAERIAWLTNPIDVETYRPEAADTVDDDSDSNSDSDFDSDDEDEDAAADYDYNYDFVWVGRFGPEKDPHRFVAAMDALESRRQNAEYTAVMVGDGALHDEVAAHIRARGLEDTIELAGWVDDPIDYYRCSRAFVLTSERDALPLVLLEAMATGLAPIVPRVGSIPDAVTDGQNGIIVPDRQPETIAAAMERLLDEPELRRSHASAATEVRNSFSMAQAGSDWARIVCAMAETGGSQHHSSSSR